MGVTPTLPLALHALPRAGCCAHLRLSRRGDDSDGDLVSPARDPVRLRTAEHGQAAVPEPAAEARVRQRRRQPGRARRSTDRRELSARAGATHRGRARRRAAGRPAERISGTHFQRIDVLRPAYQARRRHPLVLNVGRWSFKKGLDLLLDAIAEIPRVHLALVGFDDGDGTRADLEARRDRIGLRTRVHFVPPFDERQPRELYSEADVFVLSSRDESFGMVAAEAAAAGVASSSPTSAASRSCARPGRARRAGRSGAIRAAIERLLVDDELRERLGEGGRAVARRRPGMRSLRSRRSTTAARSMVDLAVIGQDPAFGGGVRCRLKRSWTEHACSAVDRSSSTTPTQHWPAAGSPSTASRRFANFAALAGSRRGLTEHGPSGSLRRLRRTGWPPCVPAADTAVGSGRHSRTSGPGASEDSTRCGASPSMPMRLFFGVLSAR